MDAQILSALAAAAAGNGWELIGLLENPAREGYRPNGTAAIDRPRWAAEQALAEKLYGDPNAKPDPRSFASLRWSIREDGLAYFFSGEYDLTREDALQRLTARAEREVTA